jgi:hypothetical protein
MGKQGTIPTGQDGAARSISQGQLKHLEYPMEKGKKQNSH